MAKVQVNVWPNYKVNIWLNYRYIYGYVTGKCMDNVQG
jgi:hypothetical protein